MNLLTISFSVRYDFLAFMSLSRSWGTGVGGSSLVLLPGFDAVFGESLDPLDRPLSLLVRSPSPQFVEVLWEICTAGEVGL